MRESFEYIKKAKWHAKSYCDDNGMKFKLIAGKGLGHYYSNTL